MRTCLVRVRSSPLRVARWRALSGPIALRDEGPTAILTNEYGPMRVVDRRGQTYARSRCYWRARYGRYPARLRSRKRAPPSPPSVDRWRAVGTYVGRDLRSGR